MPDTLGFFSRQMGLLLSPLGKVTLDPVRGSEDLFRSLGFELPAGVTDVGLAVLDFEDLFDALYTVINSTDAERKDTLLMLSRFAKLAVAIGKLFEDIDQLAQSLSHFPPDYLQKTQLLTELPLRLVDLLLGSYIEKQNNTLFCILNLIGIAEVEGFDADPTIYQTAHRRHTIYWDRIGALFSDQRSLMKEVYGWGTPQLDQELLLTRLARVLQRFGERVDHGPVPQALEEDIAGHAVPEAATDPMSRIEVSVVHGSGLDPVDVGVELIGLRATSAGASDGGLAVVPFLHGQADLEIPLSDDMPLFFELDTKLDLEGGVGLMLRPGHADLKLLSGTALDGRLGIGVNYGNDHSDPITLLAIQGATLFQVQQLFVRAGAEFLASTLDPFVEAGVAGGHIIISLADGDSFISSITPKDGIDLKFEFSGGWSRKRGVYFKGSAALELTFAINLSIGPFSVDTLHVVISLGNAGVGLELSVSGSGSVGPVSASIDRIGVKANLAFQKGNLGPVDLGIGFRPPTGLGISVDAGPVTGGGFIDFDPDAGRYSGVLALSLFSIQIKAIGLLDTKLPNGESGYSFLVIISVEFTPIQLGFGFTLNGVGGLCGINRDFVSEALQAGLRAHSLDHILFPKDPVKNAPAIISDLRTIFPAAEGRYVFGPMLEIGWGGGLNLVTAELGVILVVPSPVIIAILGQLNVMLPNPDAAIVELHLDVLGIIDFGKKLFSLDASLHDSRVVVFTIYGDMAMRLSWGDHPSFALSIGGLNPHFQPPDGFPSLKRLTIALSASDVLSITVQSYFAITSNSFQFGAKAELYAGVSAFNVYGWVGFDALFIFTPFSFIIDFTAGLALRSGTTTLLGISVDGELSGPTPWHVSGDASVTILFFEITVHVDFTWGDSKKVQPPAVDAWPPLLNAIQDPQSWSGSIPSSIPTPVSVSAPKDSKLVLVDPNGILTLRQRVLPFNQKLTKFGEAVPGPQSEFDLTTVALGGNGAPFTLINDKFAPAQFEEMSDQDKLSRPSFEDRVAGFSVGAGQLTMGNAVGVDLSFEDIYVDDLGPGSLPKIHFLPSLAQQLVWAQMNGVAQSALRGAGLGRFAPAPGTPGLVSLGDELFVVANTDDLTQRPDITDAVPKGQAFQALAAHLAANPNERGRLQVVPLFELVA